MAKSRDRVELKNSVRSPLPNGKDIGPIDLNQQIEVTVYLRPSAGLANTEAIGKTPISSRTYLSREEFAGTHGAQAEDIQSIRAFAEEYGLRVVSEDAARRMVKLGGTVEAFNQAFGKACGGINMPQALTAAARGRSRFPQRLQTLLKACLGWTIVHRQSRTSECASEGPGRRRAVLVRRFRSQTSTTSLQDSTGRASALELLSSEADTK